MSTGKNEFVFPHGQGTTESVYAQTAGEIEALAHRLDAVSDTKIYIAADSHRHGAPEPYDGISTNVLLNLDDWR